MNELQSTKAYADTYALTIEVFKRSKSIPKAQRPTLGRGIEEACLEILTSVRLAGVSGSPSQKRVLCQRASDALDRVRIFVQLLKDLGCVTEQSYFSINEKSSEVGRQLGGWMKSLKG